MPLPLRPDLHVDAVVRQNKPLERSPPQEDPSIRKACRDKDAHRCAMALEERQPQSQVVTVTVVERKARETTAKSLFREPLGHVVDRDDLMATLPDMLEAF